MGLAESTEQMDVDETTVQISEDKSAEDTDVQQEVLDTVARVISTFSAGEFQAALVALVETVVSGVGIRNLFLYLSIVFHPYSF